MYTSFTGKPIRRDFSSAFSTPASTNPQKPVARHGDLCAWCLEAQLLQVRVAAALDQRDPARLVHVHLHLVPPRRAVRRAVHVRPVGARRVSPLPFRQRGGPRGRRPAVVRRVRLAEAAAPEVPQLDAELAFELFLQHRKPPPHIL